MRFFLEPIVVRDMLHDFLNTAFQDIAKPVNCIDLNVLILPKSVKQRAIDPVMGVKVILRHAAIFHRFPQPIILDHPLHPQHLIFLYYCRKML